MKCGIPIWQPFVGGGARATDLVVALVVALAVALALALALASLGGWGRSRILHVDVGSMSMSDPNARASVRLP